MVLRLGSCTLAVGIMFLASLASAGQDQVWIEQFGTSDHDKAKSAAPDDANGVYVSGSTWGSLGGANAGFEDGWLARLDDAGDQLWVRQFGTSTGDFADATAPDALGGVFVSGTTWGSLGGPSAGATDAWLARYDSAGNRIWIRQFGTTMHEWSLAAAPDNAAGVYVCGYTEGNLGGTHTGSVDAWLARYDGMGNQLWISQLGSNNIDIANAVCPDGSGGVYIAGRTRGSLGGPHAGLDDAWLARFDGTGNQVWLIQLGASAYDDVKGAAPDGMGGVFVVGTSVDGLGGPIAGQNAWLARFDGAGNQFWIRQIASSDADNANAALPDASGGVYVAGETRGNLGGTNMGGFDAWLARFDSTGSEQWFVQLGTSGSDVIYAAAPDGKDGVLVAGLTAGSLGGPSTGGQDAWLARYATCAASTYCSSAINSTGQSASIGYHGSTSVSQNDLVLTVASCPPNQLGIFVFGLFQTQVAFGDGYLCVTGGVNRLLPAVFLSTQGAGAYPIDFADPTSPASLLQPGDSRNFQFWYRDPQLIGSGFNLSDGLSAYFCP